jgi:hypothetical protein
MSKSMSDMPSGIPKFPRFVVNPNQRGAALNGSDPTNRASPGGMTAIQSYPKAASERMLDATGSDYEGEDAGSSSYELEEDCTLEEAEERFRRKTWESEYDDGSSFFPTTLEVTDECLEIPISSTQGMEK